MLLELAELFRSQLNSLHLFQYVTFRTIMSALTALVVAFDAAQRRSEEAAHIERLEDRIRCRRVVFAAVLHVMRSHALCEEEAFALIRQTAMRYRTTIEQLSAEIMALGGMPNRTSRTA